jgi:hypothetical protein
MKTEERCPGSFRETEPAYYEDDGYGGKHVGFVQCPVCTRFLDPHNRNSKRLILPLHKHTSAKEQS